MSNKQDICPDRLTRGVPKERRRSHDRVIETASELRLSGWEKSWILEKEIFPTLPHIPGHGSSSWITEIGDNVIQLKQVQSSGMRLMLLLSAPGSQGYCLIPRAGRVS
jgi:hypothetical protein